ncbi:helix-turn-helix transcriptional regulator [Stutzerimonas chloritidismutans]|uniref:helix-turn-helix transcriptional regulator n=1 Tax=Stutzerimonas chloritidismutans TaxID=203192 RepID=UPI003F1662F4
MIDKACSALVSTPSRVTLLSHSEVLDTALRQYLHELPQLRMNRSTVLRGQPDMDLVLIDVASFAGPECERLLRQLRDVPTALINAQPDQARTLLVRHPWIRGVFYPSTSRSILQRGIATILEGGDWLPRALMEKLLGRYRELTSASRAIDDLSEREKQILALAGKGLSNAEIAERLHLSTHTIKSHIHNALGKLGASNRAQGASLVLGHVAEALA